MTAQFDGAGNLSEKEVYGSDYVSRDVDQTWKTDSGLVPKRVLFEVTKIREPTSESSWLKVGNKNYCVYEVTTTSPPKLRMLCGSSRFPVSIPKEDDRLSNSFLKNVK